ncbi:uncharacterized protein LOC116932016 isoform X2 [Daphnia magna]|uniref:uncharacterized protein LOC116932016 isoform X2 n=1 Tax=Daphnia magna TaxID=35525 RepID=UPI0006E89800|nr:uncharacterized protein LOC116932016 isoform X2 [Daphnia magna]
MEIKAQEMLTIEYGDVYYLTCAEYSSLWFDHHLMPLISLSELVCIGLNTIIPFVSTQLDHKQLHYFPLHTGTKSTIRTTALLSSSFAFASSLSSSTLLPLGHRCLRLRLLLCVIAVFVSFSVLDPAIKRHGLAKQKR